MVAFTTGFATVGTHAQVSSILDTPADSRPQGEIVPLPNSARSVVYGIGKATIYQGDIATARKIALQAAYAEAVSQGAGLEIGSLTLIKNVSLVTDLVTSQSRGIIRRYTVVQEEISADGSLLTLGIEATVEAHQDTTTDSRQEALKLLLGILGNPQILVLIPQYDTLVAGQQFNIQDIVTNQGYLKSASAPLPIGSLRGTEAAFSQSLAESGYRTATPDMAVGRVNADLLSRARSGETVAAIEVAKEIGADIVLIGSLSASTKRINPQGVEFESVSAEFAARAFVTSTGQDVETLFESATATHINRLAAISKIKKALAEQMKLKVGV